MTTSAHELMRTRDCRFPNCDREAEPRSILCAFCLRLTDEGDMQRLARMYGDDPDHRPTPEQARKWKRSRSQL